MKAIVQRRLTPALVLLCTVLGVLLVALVAGLGRGVRWLSPQVARSFPAVTHPFPVPSASPLISLQEIWQRPLFDPERKPMLVTSQVTQAPVMALGDVTLTGIVLTDDLQVALLRDAAGKSFRVKLGELYEGWRLTTLEPRRVVFTTGESMSELILPVKGRDGAAKAGETSLGPQPAHPVATPQSTPMMMLTNAAADQSEATLRGDDSKVRSVRLEALKNIVLQRRAKTLHPAGGQ